MAAAPKIPREELHSCEATTCRGSLPTSDCPGIMECFGKGCQSPSSLSGQGCFNGIRMPLKDFSVCSFLPLPTALWHLINLSDPLIKLEFDPSGLQRAQVELTTPRVHKE